MTKFAVVDLSNLFHRARYVAMADPETKAALAMQIIFRSLRKLYRGLQVDHMVFAIDRGSWRTAIYPAYKSRRRLASLTATPQDQSEQKVFLSTFDSLVQYLATDTRCTVLAAADVESDDFIARWIIRHPHDDHIIVSGDSDFVQLIAENVQIFDAMNQRTIHINGITDDHEQNLSFIVSPKDGKIKIGEPDASFVPEPEWWRKSLFIKLVRGDVADSVFSAFPGVRYKGKKCSIHAAWDDRSDQGYDWNNLMFQTWDKLLENGTSRVRVIDEYRINERLIDLTKQPPQIIQVMDAAINAAISPSTVKQVGMHFLQFCTAHDLPALIKEATDHVVYLNAPYR